VKINGVNHTEIISKYMNTVNGNTPKVNYTSRVSDSLELSDDAKKLSSYMRAAKEMLEKSEHEDEINAAKIMEKIKSNDYSIPDDKIIEAIISGLIKGN